jgi:hypothetical protein
LYHDECYHAVFVSPHEDTTHVLDVPCKWSIFLELGNEAPNNKSRNASRPACSAPDWLSDLVFSDCATNLVIISSAANS